MIAAPLAVLLATSPRMRLTLGDLLFAAFVGLAAISIAVNGSHEREGLCASRSVAGRLPGVSGPWSRVQSGIVCNHHRGRRCRGDDRDRSVHHARRDGERQPPGCLRLRRGVGLFREIVRLHLVCARVLNVSLLVLLAVALVPAIVFLRCDGSASVYRHRRRVRRHRAHDRAPHAGRRDLRGHRCGLRGRHAGSASDVAALDRIRRSTFLPSVSASDDPERLYLSEATRTAARSTRRTPLRFAEALTREAFAMIPRAGFFGIGLVGSRGVLHEAISAQYFPPGSGRAWSRPRRCFSSRSSWSPSSLRSATVSSRQPRLCRHRGDILRALTGAILLFGSLDGP